MTDTFKFDNYKIIYWGGDTKYSISVKCYSRDSIIGEMVFNSGAVVDADSMHPDGYPRINYTYDDFSNIYQILLHEKPLYLNVAAGGNGYLTTDREYIGEEE